MDVSAYKDIPCKVAGRVPRGDNPGELNLDSYVSPADQRVMSLASAYALVAAAEALADARWKPQTVEEKQRTGELMICCKMLLLYYQLGWVFLREKRSRYCGHLGVFIVLVIVVVLYKNFNVVFKLTTAELWHLLSNTLVRF